MTDLRKAAEDLLEVVEAAIKAGDWKVDGACDPDSAIVRLRQALAQPVDAVNISQERVDETAKHEQEPVAWVYNGILHEFDPSEFATSEVKPLYTAPPKREWVGLTDEERQEIVEQEVHWSGICRAIEAKLKEKNNG